MVTTDNIPSDAASEAKAFYNAELRDRLEPAQNGKYIVIDPASYDYEVDDRLVVASVHLRDRQPSAQGLAFRIGYDAKSYWPEQSNLHTAAIDGDPDGSPSTNPAARKARIHSPPASLQAEAFYNAELRAQLEPAENGKYIVISEESHDYEVDRDPIAAAVHLQDRQPDAEMFIFCIGCGSEQYALHGWPLSI